jgi:hypothetical protein
MDYKDNFTALPSRLLGALVTSGIATVALFGACPVVGQTFHCDASVTLQGFAQLFTNLIQAHQLFLCFPL